MQGDPPPVVVRRRRRNQRKNKPRAVQPPSSTARQNAAFGSRPARPLPKPEAAPAPKPVVARPPTQTQLRSARAQRAAYVSQGKSVAGDAYRAQSVKARRQILKNAQRTPASQRTADQRAAISVHHQRAAGDAASRKLTGVSQAQARALSGRAQEYVSQGAAVAAAAKAADAAAQRAERKREAEKPVKVGGVNLHVKPGVIKAIADNAPVIGTIVKNVRSVDATSKQLEAPAAAVLKNIDRPANAVRTSIKHDIQRGGVKEAFLGVHAPGSKAAKDRTKAFKRGIELKEQTTGSDVLKAAGVKNKAVRAIGGFGVDAATSAATLPVGGVGSTAARAGEKAAARVITKAPRAARVAAKGARAGARARGASRAAQKEAGREAAQVARGRVRTLAERRRQAAIAAHNDRGGQGIGIRLVGSEIPGSRRATAAVARGVRKVTRRAPGKTEAERQAAQKFAQAERTARGGKEQAMARAQRVARQALRGLSPEDHDHVAHALANNDIRSLPERLRQPAIDLRSAFRHEFKAERQAGVSDVRHPEDFLTKADRKKLKKSIESQRTAAIKGQATGRSARDADRLATHTARRDAIENIPQRGRGQGVPITESHQAWLTRVRDYAEQHDLRTVRKRADKLLSKAVDPADVERGYFPREFADRAERQAGVGESTPAPGGVRVVRTGTAKTATPATGGRARVDPRRLEIVQAERVLKGEDPFSTNVPLVAGSRVRSAGRAVAEADFARNVASHGRRITHVDQLKEGEKLYKLGREGGKYGLHPVRSISSKRGGQHVALPEHTVKAMEEANRPMPAVEAKMWDKLTGGWKTLQTYSPRFHLRNAYGDVQRLMEMPGNPISNVAKLREGTTAARAVRQSERYRQAPGFGGRSDPLNKATIKVAGKDMPARQFVNMLREHKLVDVGRTQQERTEAAIMRGGGPETGKILRGGPFQGMQGGPFGGRVGRGLSVDTPNAIRAAAFKAGLDMGMTPARAADQAHKFFVDYGKLSAKERIYARRIFPFYTWTARSLPVTLANYAANPARYANLNNARNEWNQAVTGLSPDELDAQMKPYTRNNLPVIIPIGGGKFAAVSASWPANLVQYAPVGIGPHALAGSGAQFYKLGAGQLNWVARDIVEMGLGTITHGEGVNIQTGRSIEDPTKPRVKAPSWAADLPPWAKKQLLVDHVKDKVTGQDQVVWRGWANWALRQGSVGLAGQAAQATDTARAGRLNTTPAKIAEFLGVTMEDMGPDVTKANEQIKKYQRVAELNKKLQQLPPSVDKDHPTSEYTRLRGELNKLNRELRPPKPKAGNGIDIGLDQSTGPKVDIGLDKSAGPKVDIGLGG